jgi:hypothetical protein
MLGSTTAHLASGGLDDDQLDARLGRACGWLRAGVAGIDTGDLDALIRHRLHLRGQGLHV